MYPIANRARVPFLRPVWLANTALTAPGSLRLAVPRFSYATLSNDATSMDSTDAAASATRTSNTIHQPLEKPFKYENHRRNVRIKDAWKAKGPEIQLDVQVALGSPWVPEERTAYINRGGYEFQRRKVARTLVGFKLLNRPSIKEPPPWRTLLSLLESITPRPNQSPSMAAVRVIMPKTWDIETGARKVEYIDRRTGLLAKVQVSMSKQDPSSFVIRGRSDLLSSAVNELVAKCQDIKVYQLGDLGSFGFDGKRLWPVIEGAPAEVDGEDIESRNKRALESLWVHRDPPVHFIETPYEEIAQPEVWTTESLEAYVTTITQNRLRSDLVMKYYSRPFKHLKPGGDGKLVNTEAIRVQLLLSALSNEAAKNCATASIVKMVMAFLSRCIGYIARADDLLFEAMSWGVSMDADAFNILLQGYLVRRDVSLFYRTLCRMKEHEVPATFYTWLLFLKLLQRAPERQEAIAAMEKLGILDEESARRGLAMVTAASHAYEAFRHGKSLGQFIDEHSKRCGNGEWLNEGALNDVLGESLRFVDPYAHSRGILGQNQVLLNEYKKLFLDRPVALTTINIFLRHAAASQDWHLCDWAMGMLDKGGYRPNFDTYTNLLALARATHHGKALAIIFFFAIMERRMRTHARDIMDGVLLASTTASPQLDNSTDQVVFDETSSANDGVFSKGYGSLSESIPARSSVLDDANNDNMHMFSKMVEIMNSRHRRFSYRDNGLTLCFDRDISLWQRSPPLIFSHEQSHLLEENKMMPSTRPTSGAEWAILSSCHDWLPRHSLYYELCRANVFEKSPTTNTPTELELMDKTGKLPDQVISLNESFDPARMIRPVPQFTVIDGALND